MNVTQAIGKVDGFELLRIVKLAVSQQPGQQLTRTLNVTSDRLLLVVLVNRQ